MTGAPAPTHEVVVLDARTSRGRLVTQGRSLTLREVLAGWRDSARFRTTFAEGLSTSPFDAFFWETPPWTRATLDEVYEHVLVDAPALLAMRPAPDAFATHFGAAPAARFPNLGGDAVLVAPSPRDAPHAAHLAEFVRRGTPSVIDALFRELGEALESRLGETPVWLSTAGLGVAWLHVRLDERPKYYQHQPYRRGP